MDEGGSQKKKKKIRQIVESDEEMKASTLWKDFAKSDVCFAMIKKIFGVQYFIDVTRKQLQNNLLVKKILCIHFCGMNFSRRLKIRAIIPQGTLRIDNFEQTTQNERKLLS
ncbi:hypothetical protein P5673_011633 [Acropora cervicornis]|uniref:Uncharacterized protein n=1 Tax=Acropora cervicornis TaxID=6130 RepID=A0AAD9QPH6_ACRCE|nr:hypothetical protein P5673_011633 [Acropora cervicornis]